MTEVQAALRAVDGVRDAVVEEADGAPVGVRVELETGADERSVASSVQSVLSSYGLRSRLAPPRSKLEPVVPPPPPTVLPIRPTHGDESPEGPAPAVEPPRIHQPVDGVSEISLTQRDHGVIVAVTDWDGNSIELLSRTGDQAVTQSIIEAVSELTSPGQPSPGIHFAEVGEGAGAQIVTVVLDIGDGDLRAAAEMVTAGRELAIARAAWKALTADS